MSVSLDRFWMLRAAAVMAGAALVALVAPGGGDRRDGPAGFASDWLATLPAGRWQRVETHGSQHPPFRFDHSGAVYDPQRERLLLFGADTHRISFDGGLYSLSLDTLQWRLEHAGVPQYGLWTDAAGRRVAGLGNRQPWPQHVYDSLVYDPVRRSLLLASGAKHSFMARPGAQVDPTWEYSLEERRWSILDTGPDAPPNFFATGAVYDPGRDTLIAYGAMPDERPFLALAAEDEIERVGVWELGPARDRWVMSSPEVHHWGWFNAEFDTAHGVMLVFGGEFAAEAVWAYRPGRRFGERGAWERRVPDGDRCPIGYYSAAAYDSRRRTTLIMARDWVARRSVACRYDYASNRMTRLEDASLPLLDLNYTMIYSPRLDAFVMIAGSFSVGAPTAVLVLKPAG